MTRRTVRIDDTDWQNLELESKKFGFSSCAEYLRHLVQNQLTGGRTDQELTVKQQTELLKLEILRIKKPTEKIKKLSNTLKLWKEAKAEGYTLEQFQKMITNETETLEKPLGVFTRTPENISKQFKAYGTTIIHSKPEDADKVRCPDCNWCLDYKPNDVTVEVNHMINHLKSIHHRTPTEDEQKILQELIA